MQLNNTGYFKLIIILLLLSNGVFAQKKAKKVKADKWQPGYVILKNNNDTLKGYLHLKKKYMGYIRTVWFSKTKEAKLKTKGVLKVVANGDLCECNENSQDLIRYFGVDNKRYKYVDYTDSAFPHKKILQPNKVAYQLVNSFSGWCEIIEEGTITLSLAIAEIGGQGHGAMMAPSGGMTAGGGSGKMLVPMYLLEKKTIKKF